jgi:Na+-translocating ferredoxin:NAD+ oxidoreductase RnfE subunit
LIEHEFAVSRRASIRRHNAHIVTRQVRRQIMRDGSFVGLGVVVVLLVLELLRAVLG